MADKGSRSSSNGSPVLNNIGDNILTHKRHLLQKAEYTCAVTKDYNGNNEISYCTHTEAIKEKNNSEYEIIKFTLPYTERDKILEHLKDVNINAFSLFQTEEALCEDIARDDTFLKINK